MLVRRVGSVRGAARGAGIVQSALGSDGVWELSAWARACRLVSEACLGYKRLWRASVCRPQVSRFVIQNLDVLQQTSEK